VSPKGLSRLYGALTLVLLGLTMSASPAVAAQDQAMTIVLTDPFFTANPCTTIPDPVTLTGTMRMTFTVVGLAANGMPDTYLKEVGSDLKGVGDVTLSPYVVTQTDTFNQDTMPSGTTVIDTIVHENVISHGIAPDFRLHVTIHLTVNSQNTPTASVSDIRPTCT